MISFSPLLRGVFSVAFLLLAMVGAPVALAQEPGASGSSVNYQNAPVNTILDLYEVDTGMHLVRDTNLSGVPPISVNATGLSKADTIKMIEATLLLNGVAFVPLDSNTLKVVTVGTNKNPRTEGVKLYANAADLPTDEEIVSYYMPLNFISPQEAQGIFSLQAPTHLYGSYVPAPSAQAIIITENTGVIRQLIALKELIDVPPAAVTTEFVQLHRADAEKVADTVNKMLGTSATGTGTPQPGAGAGQVIVPADVGTTAPLSNEHNLISGTALVIPETRSNRIILITRPVNMPFLERIISQLDEPNSFLVPQRRALNYVLAEDILPALEAALAQGKDEEEQVQKDQGNAKSSTSGQQQTQQQAQQPSISSNGGLGSSGGGSVSAITPQLQEPEQNNVPTVVTIGKTRLMADNRSNSIIVFGAPDVVTRVFDMIDQLDRKPLQVYLDTVIGQLTVKQGLEFGIDLLQKFQKVGQGGLSTSNNNTSVFGTPTSFVEPNSLTSAAGFPLTPGLTLYGAIGSTLDAYLRALETTDRFKIISRPSVYTSNNKLAVIASGSQVPVPSNITSGFNGTGTGSNDLVTTASVQYENVLLQLDIVPLINADHEVTLKIRQTNNTIGAENEISGNQVPTINTQEINTEITVPDKSTVVIGGLISDQTTRDSSGVPFLSDIPVLQYLFSDTSKSKERDELIIMIQPKVVETQEDANIVNQDEKQRTILGQEAQQAAEGTNAPPVVIPSPYASARGVSVRSTTTTTTTTSETPTGAIPLPPSFNSASPDVSYGKMPGYVKPPSKPATSQ